MVSMVWLSRATIGMVYNKGLFEELGVKVPETFAELETAIEQFNAAGITPFSSGFGEWWVFKHAFQHFLAAATDTSWARPTV